MPYSVPRSKEGFPKIYHTCPQDTLLTMLYIVQTKGFLLTHSLSCLLSADSPLHQLFHSMENGDYNGARRYLYKHCPDVFESGPLTNSLVMECDQSGSLEINAMNDL